MLATIWQEIVSWFLTISQDLRKMITRLFLFWFSYQCRIILWSQQTSMVKNQKSTNNAMSNDGSKYGYNKSVSWRLSRINLLKLSTNLICWMEQLLFDPGFFLKTNIVMYTINNITPVSIALSCSKSGKNKIPFSITKYILHQRPSG